MNRRTDLMTAVTGVMLLAVALYFILPGLVGGLADNIGSVALHAAAPSSTAPSESIAGGSTLTPKSTTASPTPPVAQPDLDLGSNLGVPSPIFPSPSAAPPPGTQQPTSTSSDLGTVGPTHLPKPPQPPQPGPTLQPPTHHTPHPNPPQPQTVTINSALPNPASVGTDTVVDATASSGLPVSLTSDTPSVCSFSGTTLSFVGAGQCTIHADQSGDSNWLPASATQSTTVQ